MTNTVSYPRTPVASLDADARARFITRTYGHLFAAIAGFTGLEIFLFTSGLAVSIARGACSAPAGCSSWARS